ncbi:MAG: DUF3365 domain-containing protein [Magnetospirillum sp.]|nr:DUF3365 domain-containing protein [Magnetospirillum sp.]
MSGFRWPWRVAGTRGWSSLVVAALVAVWSAVMAVSLGLDIVSHRAEALRLANSEARASLDKDLAFRLWGTGHGGVYVPVDERTPPNPYLSHVPERDIVTPSGRALTLMNPAYMLRQAMSEFGDLYGVRGRITSLKILNPINTPDAWERSALARFDAGERQVAEVVDAEGKPVLRMMRAMIMEEGCLKCHAKSGIKLGEVRGGIGVAIQLERYFADARRLGLESAFTHLMLWAGGLAVILVAGRRLMKVAVQRDRALDVLSASEERYRRIVETAQEGMWTLDHRGITVSANAVMAGMLGLSPSAMPGRPLCDFLPHGSEAMAADLVAGFAVRPGRCTLTLQRADATLVDMVVSAGPLDDGGAAPQVLLMVTEVAAPTDEQETLKRVIDQLAASNVDLDRFAHAAAHDLREPTRVMVSFSQLLERQYGGQLDDRAEEYLHFICDAARRMNSLVEDLVVYAHASSPGDAFQTLNLDQLAAEAVAGLQRAIGDSGAVVEIGRLPQAMGDRGQVGQVLHQLIGNAVKYRHPDRPPRVSVTGQTVGDAVELAIADNGLGIEPQYLDDIFTAFRRLHPPGNYPGSGVGLALAKRIVDRHGGRLWAESIPGAGSVFRFTLPAA